ncbi:hypothetical protein I6A84_29075 [Frankia sp. CNm7]|uniref:Uncharacterized protein n=1 Tax=Frankia nepalensis TaxID=1836974 RepID=A0A937RK36_9ACTN|nr:hypothetical protein [Frankia nepalensis]MBL7497822.1 hypothetical protein [Frankia nepalensis]MBL7512648.1 hypothetical protein [Frankia nepalensis]MBL7522021.1 hypothetical protein [Frankia nepalensis]MBL7631722.1 hypothetical protein [Frankia nepalensis]
MNPLVAVVPDATISFALNIVIFVLAVGAWLLDQVAVAFGAGWLVAPPFDVDASRRALTTSAPGAAVETLALAVFWYAAGAASRRLGPAGWATATRLSCRRCRGAGC